MYAEFSDVPHSSLDGVRGKEREGARGGVVRRNLWCEGGRLVASQEGLCTPSLQTCHVSCGEGGRGRGKESGEE